MGSSRDTYSRLSRWLLNVSKTGDSTASLCNLCQCAVVLTVKKCFQVFSWSLLHQLSDPPLDSLQYAHVCLILESPIWAPGFPGLTNARKTISLLCCRDTVLAYSQLGVHQDYQGVLSQTAVQLGSPQCILIPGVVPPSGQDMAFPLLN